MEANCLSVFSVLALVWNFKSFGCIVPDVDETIGGRHNQLLTQTDIHSCNRLRVERSVQWFHRGNISGWLFAVVAELDSLELVVAINSVDLIFRFTQTQTCNPVNFIPVLLFVVEADLRLENRVRCPILKRLILIRPNETVSTTDDQTTSSWENAINSITERRIFKVVLEVTIVVTDNNFTLGCADVQLTSLVERVTSEVIWPKLDRVRTILLLELVFEDCETVHTIVNLKKVEAARTRYCDDQVGGHVEFGDLERVGDWVNNAQVDLSEHLEDVVLP